MRRRRKPVRSESVGKFGRRKLPATSNKVRKHRKSSRSLAIEAKAKVRRWIKHDPTTNTHRDGERNGVVQ